MPPISDDRSALKYVYAGRFLLLVVGIIACGVSWWFVGIRLCAYVLFVVSVCIVCLQHAVQRAKELLNADEGTDDGMKRVAAAIREGAEGFIATQYGTIAKMSVVVAVLLFVAYALRESGQKGGDLFPGSLGTASVTLVCFAVGACFSGAAGFVGLWISVRVNLRVAVAASKLQYPNSFHYALRGGLACGVFVVGMCVMGLCLLFTFFHALFGSSLEVTSRMPHYLVGYGFGASFVALFAQLGGGIYTKAADVGADMVGKVEANIPEDDPRNPAVIADLVGDNVGDCAGRGADLFESIAGEILGAMILGGSLAQRCGIQNPSSFVLFPLLLHAMDLVVSSVAVGIVKIHHVKLPEIILTGGDAEKGQTKKSVTEVCDGAEDPLKTLERGYILALCQAAVVIVALSYWLLNPTSAPVAWLHYCLCGFVGIVTSYLFVLITKYYTDFKYAPVQRIAAASRTGHGTNVIAGLAVGLESTALPALVCGIALISSYWLGQTSGLTDSTGKPTGGLYGTAIATMGMLSTAVYVLAMDTFGPITDNAGGIVEMSEQEEDARTITDRLDAVGNVTKATTKGYSIGAAALAAFLLLRAFLDVAEEYAHQPVQIVDLAIPEVFIAALMGGTLIFIFSGWAMAAVGHAASEVVEEVRRQFAEKPGIMQNQQRPDYNRCVTIVTQAALKEMVRPGLLAVCTPVVVGLSFRLIGYATAQPLLGIKAVAGLLMFSTATGILMALFLNNSGGAFDNAKKYIEGGAHGGKHSFAHQAAVTGDTLGDPLKDTAGPSIHVLIKLLSTIALVTCPLFLN